MIWTLESRFIPALDLKSTAAGLFFALLAAILPARVMAADLLFEDVTSSAGIDQVGESWGAAWGCDSGAGRFATSRHLW